MNRMIGFAVLATIILMERTESMVLSGRSRLLKNYEQPSLFSESALFGSFSDKGNSKIQRRQQRMRQNIERFFNEKSTPPSTRPKEKRSHKDIMFANSNNDEDLKQIQQNLLKQYGEPFHNTNILGAFSDISDHQFLEQFSGDFKKTPSPNSKYKSNFRSDSYQNIMYGHARVKKGFCRLLCATCEDMASRRWSILCGSQCESGGIAYNVCLMVYRNFDGNTRPTDVE